MLINKQKLIIVSSNYCVIQVKGRLDLGIYKYTSIKRNWDRKKESDKFNIIKKGLS